MPKPKPKTPSKPSVDTRFAPVVAALGKHRNVAVEPGWGRGNFVLKVGGKIFAILSTDRFVVKLPRGRVDELVSQEHGTRFDPRKNGRVMKEWIVVVNEARWLELAREAFRFVRE
jgi:hypothetical protein